MKSILTFFLTFYAGVSWTVWAGILHTHHRSDSQVLTLAVLFTVAAGLGVWKQVARET